MHPAPRSSRFRLAAYATTALMLLGAAGPAGAQQPDPDVGAQQNFQWPRGDWWDTSRSATFRANALLAQMTLEEKVDMLHGELNNDYGFFNAGIPRLGIPSCG